MKRKQLLSLVVVGTLLLGFVNATGDNLYYRRIDGIDTISICDPDDINSCITMMDRNLGATEVGIGCEEYSCREGRSKYVYENYYGSLQDCIDDGYDEDECLSQFYDSADECVSDAGDNYDDILFCLGRSLYGDTFTSEEDCNNRAELLYNQCLSLHTGVRGNHYQRGNNYGFNLNDESVVENATINQKVDTTNYGPHGISGWYYDGTFRIVNVSDYNWSSVNNANLRGGNGDSSNNGQGLFSTNPIEDRQGPCPNGYHVPSLGEWNNLLNNWGEWIFNGSQIPMLQFRNDLKIPFAGYRRGNDAQLEGLGSYAGFWSSSANSFKILAVGGFSLGYGQSPSIQTNSPYPSEALSVRCFKDSPIFNKPFVEEAKESFENLDTQIGNTMYSGMPQKKVAINTVNQEAGKPVLGEVNLDFFTNESVSFSELITINIPVDGDSQVEIKVKHGGSDEYNYDGLTTNIDASCSNGEVVEQEYRYNGEAVNVVDGYVTIYTCSASSFIALGLGEGESLGEVTLTLTAGENTCTLNDYNLGTHNVSSEDQNVSTSGQNIVCEFLKNTSATIQLSMGDLVDGAKEIGRQYFTGVVSSLGNPLGTIANLTGGSYNFSGSHIIYTKQANTIGTWTGSLAIEGIIPAGTPGGQYTGELNVIICEGC